MPRSRRRPVVNFRFVTVTAAAAVLATLVAASASAYPLNGFDRSGIRRLLGYVAAQQATGGVKLPPGALLGVDEVTLHLAGTSPGWDLDAGTRDPELQAALEAMFAQRDPSYAVAVIDITDPERPVWAGVRETRTQLPGSVGKVLCLVALFDNLARLYPDVDDRLRILRERTMAATDWALGDPHTVPKLDGESGRNRFSVVALGDRFTLSEWIDHMISASANSAGAMVWKEAMLMRQFGADYPPDEEAERAFLRETSKAELTRLSLAVLDEPLTAAGLDLAQLRQGTFWTRASQARVPGVQSYASPRELARLLLRLEQGRLVDSWSSLEMKRYLYMTKKRYRYVYAPELADAAVYFKSGSFYQCRPEEGFACVKYRGNAKNLMNSIAIVEQPARPAEGQRQTRYLVAMLSNILKVNSAWDHSRVGAAIDVAVRTRRPAAIDLSGSEADQREVGKSD